MAKNNRLNMLWVLTYLLLFGTLQSKVGEKKPTWGCLISGNASKISMTSASAHLPDLMWLREASMRSMKEAGTVIVFLVSSSISSFRVMTWEWWGEGREEKINRCDIPPLSSCWRVVISTHLVGQDPVERGRLLQRWPDLDVVIDPWRREDWKRVSA